MNNRGIHFEDHPFLPRNEGDDLWRLKEKQ